MDLGAEPAIRLIEEGVLEVSDPRGRQFRLGKVPCVDGSVLSRVLTDIALLVGAAMCPAY
jgi:hypothetical protein